MKWHVLLIFISSLVMSSLVQSAVCDASNTATASGAADASNCTVTGSQSTIQLNFISGFNSASALAAVGGNNGTTLGAQRKLSFIMAAETIAAQVASTQVIIIDAKFSILSCDATSATLGSAGPSVSSYYSSPPTGMTANTWYPIGLINDIINSDTYLPGDDVHTGNGTGSDIASNFNSNIGNSGCLEGSSGWYYGFDDTPSGSFIGFTTVLLHEITHGLGFSSLVNPSSGAKASNLDDIFSNNLYSLAQSAAWPGLSNAQRAASATSMNGLLWAGANVNTQAIGVLTDGFNNSGTGSTTSFEADDRVEMYAPNPVEGGSSVSHFNTDAAPNELMEPQYTNYLDTLGLALYLLKDIGWTITAPSSNNVPTITAVNQTTNEDTPLTIDINSWGVDADGDTKTYSVVSCAANIACSISASNLTLTPAENYNASTNSITIGVSDGNGGSANDSFNLNVVAQNDAPAWGSISTQNVTVDGSSVAVNLATYATDVDGHALSYSQVSCGTGLTCSVSGSTLTLSASSNGGNSVLVTIQADDSNGGLTNVNIDVDIINANVIIIGGTPLDPDASVNINNTGLNIDISSVNNTASFALDLDGSDVASLMTINGNTLTLAMPDSGVFAGTYTLTVTNSAAGSPFTFELVRAPRLNFSATKLLENLSVQTLKIEGGAVGTIYTLSSDIAELTIPNNATAVNDPDSYNAVTINLTVTEIANSTDVEITASSTYEDAISSGITLEPARIQNLTMEDGSGSILTAGTFELNLSNLDAYNLTSEYSTNSGGSVSIAVPDNSVNYSLEAQHNGYTSKDVSLLSSQLNQVVTMQGGTTGPSVTIVINSSSSGGGSIGLGTLILFILMTVKARRRRY
jgi:hypothetical protein